MTVSAFLTSSPVVEPITDLAAVTRATLVNEVRAELLRSATAVTIPELAAGTGRTLDTTRRWVARKRDAGALAVITLHDGTLLVPTVQLDAAFHLDDEIASRTARLLAWGMGPWAVWGWWQTPNTWLHDGQRPADAAAAGDLGALDRAIDGLMQ